MTICGKRTDGALGNAGDLGQDGNGHQRPEHREAPANEVYLIRFCRAPLGFQPVDGFRQQASNRELNRRWCWPQGPEHVTDGRGALHRQCLNAGVVAAEKGEFRSLRVRRRWIAQP